jgi:hypothetical protein
MTLISTLCSWVNIGGQKAASLPQVGHFYSDQVGQFYTGANSFFHQEFDFALEELVFLLLALKKKHRGVALGGNAGGRELVQVRAFVLAVLEIDRLDVALFQERLPAVVDLAHADAEVLRQVALRQLRVGRQRPQQAVARFIVGSAFRH